MSAPRHPELTYKLVAFGAWIGIVGNLVLGTAKLAAGIIGTSEALIAAAVDTLSDVLSSVVVLHGAWRAGHPPDKKHPYGHGKAEVMAARTVAVILMIVGVLFGYRAMSEMVHHADRPVPASWTLWFALLSVVVKEAMYQYKIRLGRRLKSESLIADAWHHRSDSIASLFAMAGIGAAVYLGPDWRIFDPIAAVVICLIIFGMGVAAFVRTGSALMDETADAETQDAIRRAAGGVPGVKDTEKLLTRRSGIETHTDLHVEVDPALSVGDAHAIASRVSEAIRRDVPEVTRVTVHIEPYYPDDHPKG